MPWFKMKKKKLEGRVKREAEDCVIRIGDKEVITRWGDYKGFSPKGIHGDGVYSSMVCTRSYFCSQSTSL